MTSLCCAALQSKVELNRKRLADFKKSIGMPENELNKTIQADPEFKMKLTDLERALSEASEELRLHLRLSHGR